MPFEIQTDIESIQHNPGMYIGSTVNPTHLFYEVFDNSLDECLNGYADTIRIKFDPECTTIEDNGRGITLDKYELDGITKDIPEWICTKLFSGEKFDQGKYKISIGMHGIGLCAVNALSNNMHIHVRKENGDWGSYFFEKAILVEKDGGIHHHGKHSGTKVTFKPDPQYFETTRLDVDAITHRIILTRIFHPDIKLYLNGELVPNYSVYDLFYESDNSKLLPLVSIETTYVKSYITYNMKDNKTNMIGSVNLIPTSSGTHYRAMRAAISDVWDEIKGGYNFHRDDCFLGMECVFILYIENTAFSSQTKRELSVRVNQIKPLWNEFKKEFKKFLRKNWDTFAKPLMEKFQAYRESMSRLSTRDFFHKHVKYGDVGNGRVSRVKTVRKLYDCSSTDVEKTELFCVEGESAGGSILQCRDPRYHAVLPLRGKTLNATRADLETILANPEFNSLINSLGCGVAPYEDTSKVRYGKIIIVSDADPDGKQITALLLGAFAKLNPGLIQEGRIYVCVPPLYRQGDNFIWDVNNLDKSKQFFRFKGLGEMDPDEIHKIAINPSIRKVYQCDGSEEDLKNTIRVVGDSWFRKQLLIKKGIL